MVDDSTMKKWPFRQKKFESPLENFPSEDAHIIEILWTTSREDANFLVRFLEDDDGQLR